MADVSKREAAMERVRKLAEVTVERGATPSEQETATRLAHQLIEKYALTYQDFLPPAPEPTVTFGGFYTYGRAESTVVNMPDGSVEIRIVWAT